MYIYVLIIIILIIARWIGHIGIFALERIAEREEITMDYGWEPPLNP